MRKSRFTEAQIIGIIKQQEAGIATAEVCRKHGLRIWRYRQQRRTKSEYLLSESCLQRAPIHALLCLLYNFCDIATESNLTSSLALCAWQI